MLTELLSVLEQLVDDGNGSIQRLRVIGKGLRHVKGLTLVVVLTELLSVCTSAPSLLATAICVTRQRA